MAPSRTRVNLERLLRSCEKLSGDLSGRAERRRFETYLSVLQKHWQELKMQRQCGEDTLGELRRRIDRLAELLDEGKMLSGAGSGLALSQAQANAHLTRSQANAELANRLREKERMHQALRDQLNLASTAPAAAGSHWAPSSLAAQAGGSAARVSQSKLESEAHADALETEREQHDVLIAEIAHSVGNLRDRSRQMRQAVLDDTSTLDKMSEQLDSNKVLLACPRAFLTVKDSVAA